jgi:hypothetical protein
MTETCPSCSLPNTTLQWHETHKGFVCLPCAVDRRAEQLRIEAQYLKKNPIKPLK